MSWTSIALTALGIIGPIATALAVHRFRQPAPMSDHRRAVRTDRADRLDRQVAQYRASGALPPWDR